MLLTQEPYAGMLLEDLLIQEGFKPDTAEAVKKYKKKLDSYDKELKQYNINKKALVGGLSKSLKSKGFLAAVKTGDVKRATVILKETFTELFKEFQWEDFPQSIIIVCVVVIINSIFLELFTLMAGGPVAGLILTAIIVAPIVEELAKYLAIKEDIGGTYVITFSIVEFFDYLRRFAPVFGIVQTTLMRIPALIMHLVTATIQKAIIDKSDDTEMDETKKDTIALVAATAIHATFNSLAILSEV